VCGPRWYRARIRALGPFVALIPPAVLGAIAWLALRLGDGNLSGAIGLVGGVVAAPGLLVMGAPFADESRYPVAVLLSAPLWMLIGFVAARRATRSPMAMWRDFWQNYAWLALGVVVGACGALAAAAFVLGESLI
jgi:hypothetical protein